jgi:membrane protein required for colicin V production
MQIYDVIMLAVLVGCVVFGAWKGMAWQLASLGSLVISYFVALYGCDLLAPYIGAEAPWNRITAMLILYLGTSLSIWLLFRVVAGVIDRVKLKEFDRQVGALFGAAKGVLLCVAITFFAVTLSEDGRDLILQSRSGYYIAVLIDRADPIMPEGVHDVLGPYLHALDEKLDPLTPNTILHGGRPRLADGADQGLPGDVPEVIDGLLSETADRLSEPLRREFERRLDSAAEELERGLAEPRLSRDPNREPR